jgi:hypothetical protein
MHTTKTLASAAAPRPGNAAARFLAHPGRLEAVLTLVFVVAAIYLVAHFPHRDWDADEFEHLQFAWLVHWGQTPYLDFFEHHTPFYHFLMSPIFGVVPPANNQSIAAILLIFRAVSVACSAATIGLTYQLASATGGRMAAALAAILLLSDSFFIDKGVEIRPDPLAVVLVLVSVIALLRTLAMRNRPGRALLWAAVSGAALSLAILTTQKALFAAPGLAVLAASSVIQPEMRRHIAKCAAMALAAGFAAAAIVAAPFLLHGATHTFIASNFLQNAGWQRIPGYIVRYGKLAVEHDTLFVLLALAGAPWLLFTWWRHGRQPARLAPVALLASTGAGVLILPIVQRQYLLLLLPFAAIAAGAMLQALLTAAGRLRPALTAAAVATLALTLALNLHRSLSTADGAALSRTDAVVRAKLACIATLPADATIMGAWSSGMAFRRPAFRYFFLHPEIQGLITKNEYARLEQQLASHAVSPAVIDMDQFMLQMPPPVVNFLQQNYTPAGIGTLMRRNDLKLSCKNPS